MSLLAKILLAVVAIGAAIWLLSLAAGFLIWILIIGGFVSLIGLVIKLWLDSKTDKTKVAVTSQKRADKDAERALKKIEREINKH